MQDKLYKWIGWYGRWKKELTQLSKKCAQSTIKIDEGYRRRRKEGFFEEDGEKKLPQLTRSLAKWTIKLDERFKMNRIEEELFLSSPNILLKR